MSTHQFDPSVPPVLRQLLRRSNELTASIDRLRAEEEADRGKRLRAEAKGLLRQHGVRDGDLDNAADHLESDGKLTWDGGPSFAGEPTLEFGIERWLHGAGACWRSRTPSSNVPTLPATEQRARPESPSGYTHEEVARGLANVVFGPGAAGAASRGRSSSGEAASEAQLREDAVTGLARLLLG